MLLGYNVFRIISFFGSPAASFRVAYDLEGNFAPRAATRREQGVRKQDMALPMSKNTELPNLAVNPRAFVPTSQWQVLSTIHKQNTAQQYFSELSPSNTDK